MNPAAMPLLDQAVLVLAAMALFTAFALLAQTRLTAAIHTFAWQGALVAAVAALTGRASGDAHLYVSALITLALKVVLIPWMLHRLVRRLALERQADPLQHPALTLLAGAGIVVFSDWVAEPVAHFDLSATRNVIAISLAIVLLGMLMMVVRRQAVAQVLGFMAMENGLFLAAVASTHGMPLVVELGVAFDVLVAMVLFGVFFLQIKDSIDTLDIDRLSQLSASVEQDEATEAQR